MSEHPSSRSSVSRRWIATAFDQDPVVGHGIAEDAVIIAAENEHEAATVGLAALQDMWDDNAGRMETVTDRVGSVFVAPWGGRAAYRPIPATERAELQCCAGGSHNEYTGADGHYATCPRRPLGTGQPRDGGEDA